MAVNDASRVQRGPGRHCDSVVTHHQGGSTDASSQGLGGSVVVQSQGGSQTGHSGLVQFSVNEALVPSSEQQKENDSTKT